MSIKKIIYVIIIPILVFVITIEALILLGGSKNQSSKTTDREPATEEPNSQDLQCDLRTCSLWFPSPAPDQAIDELQLISLRDLKKDVVTSSSIEYTFEGTVTQVAYKNQNNDAPEEVSITVERNGKSNVFIFNGSYTSIKKNGSDVAFTSIELNNQILGTVNFNLTEEAYTSVTLSIR